MLKDNSSILRMSEVKQRATFFRYFRACVLLTVGECACGGELKHSWGLVHIQMPKNMSDQSYPIDDDTFRPRDKIYTEISVVLNVETLVEKLDSILFFSFSLARRVSFLLVN